LTYAAPLLDVRVLTVAELGLRRAKRTARVDRVRKLLGLERHACDVDCFKPLLDLAFRALALIDQQTGGPDLGLLVGREAVEILWIAVLYNCELSP